MGRIKTVPIKRTTRELLDLHPDKFSTDFNANKAVVEQYLTLQSRKIRNVIAGYITRLVRQRSS